MPADFTSYCYPGARAVTDYPELGGGLRLLLIHFIPAQKTQAWPLLLIGGLSTVPDNFRPLLYDLTKDFEVYYLETREKSSSCLPPGAAFGMDFFARDITAVVQYLHFPRGGYILAGFSFGAAVILEAQSLPGPPPAFLLLLSPTAEFHYPRWALWLMRATLYIPLRIKPFARWYLGKHYVNSREDPEMREITNRVVDSADPPKLKRTILAIAKYKVWAVLNGVRCPVLLVATSKDGIHVQAEVNRLAAAFSDCTYVDLENNTRSHGPELAALLRNFIRVRLKA